MRNSILFTLVVSSNHDHGDVFSIQHYMIKFVSDLRQVIAILLVIYFIINKPVKIEHSQTFVPKTY
jgi:hypothetical protein